MTTRPRLVLVHRPELEASDVYVLRRTEGTREAYETDGGWARVADGVEPPRLARIESAEGPGVDLGQLLRIVEQAEELIR